MGNNLGNRNNGAKRLVGNIVFQKKKTVLAVCLIMVMVFMWVRVLLRKAPLAEGAIASEQINGKIKSKQLLKVSFIELPIVVGRNDIITRDFFASSNWKNFDGKKSVVSIEEVNVSPGDAMENVIGKIAQKLTLEAIWISESPKAYINDKVLSIGDRLLIEDGINNYECEVTEIEDNMVVIRCGKAEIKLRIKEITKNSN
ncbi:MAG: hypothetical protein JW715_10945 [Sedimentisphaerales bacterium]|nr:hypothetical protein [Sedimentisphaerales bacterium]